MGERKPFGIPVSRYSVIPFNNYHRSGVADVAFSLSITPASDAGIQSRGAVTLPFQFWLLLTMVLYMVEAQCKNLDDYLKEDFRPIFLFVFSLHF